MNNLEQELLLNRFKARDFQRPFLDALLKEKKKRLLLIWPRRAGKDITAFHGLLFSALNKVGHYLYLLPTQRQARAVLFEGITHEGVRFLDYIPNELIKKKHIAEMKIELINNSIIRFSGSDNYDNLMGISLEGLVLSEYSLQDPNAYRYLRPALTATNGFVVAISTPRGKNALWSMYSVAKDSDEWFCSHLTIDDTQHISLHEIQKEIALGEMSEEMSKQEYWCDFSLGSENAYYFHYINNLRLKNQVSDVPWEPSHLVHTSWDIGRHDNTSIIWFQVIGQTVRIIDCHEDRLKGMEEYIKIVLNKPYTYGKHIGPHDLKVHEYSDNITRWAKAYNMGLTFKVLDLLPIEDGIELVRSTLPRCWFNEETTKPLIRALENYQQEVDRKRSLTTGKPLKQKYNHYADAFRYLCTGLRFAKKGTSPEDLDKRYRDTVYGTEHPDVFNDPTRY